MFVYFVLILFTDAQFFDPQLPLQFAGFAAINIPSSDTEELSNTNNYPYYPYSPFQQSSIRNHIEQLQQHHQQFIPQQVPILPQQPQLISNAISISNLPKRENGNSLKNQNQNSDKEQQQEIPEISRSGSTLEHATYLSLINDKENFQASGCGWDLIRLQCHDLFGLCKGGCRDFAIALNSPIHDCRCVPYGYLALVKLAGK